jgi:hypothetical protein
VVEGCRLATDMILGSILGILLIRINFAPYVFLAVLVMSSKTMTSFHLTTVKNK